jgi:hypothetical protein
MPAQYGISDIRRLYGTDFDHFKAYLIVMPRNSFAMGHGARQP